MGVKKEGCKKEAVWQKRGGKKTVGVEKNAGKKSRGGRKSNKEWHYHLFFFHHFFATPTIFLRPSFASPTDF